MGLGTVWFVGAGPGDPDLVTVKGRDLIHAESRRLVPPELSRRGA